MNTWLYHINPHSPEGWSYGWSVERPSTLLTSRDKKWPAGQMFRKVAVGDMICVYMKNIPPNPDGVYVIGRVTVVDTVRKTFLWSIDKKRSARTLVVPVPKHTVRKFFGRGYGSAMQCLKPARVRSWLRLLGKGELFEGIPMVKAKSVPVALSPTFDPLVSRQHGLCGELHVVGILAKRYPKTQGFRVIHVAKHDPASDHDIAVHKHGHPARLIEVKCRVGVPGDPVIMSERELACRRENRPNHSIFIVYLDRKGSIRSVVTIDSRDSFALMPRQHWLTPGI